MVARLSPFDPFPFFAFATLANQAGGLFPSASKLSTSNGMWCSTASAPYFFTNNGRNAIVWPPPALTKQDFVVQFSLNFQSSHSLKASAVRGG